MSISSRYGIGLGQLKALNPQIPSADISIEGLIVNLPLQRQSAGASAESRVVAPFCPPVPQSQFFSTWIPVTTAEKMAKQEYDVLVIGTGAGGGASIWRLCEQLAGSGKRIGVVERGDLFLPTNVSNIPTMNGANFRLYAPPEMKMIGNRLPEYAGAKVVYALGGRTLFWGAVTPRMPLSELAKWPVPIEEMDLYYKIAEQVMNVTTSYTQDSSITEVLLNRLWAHGYPEADKLPIAADLAQTSYGKLHSNVLFSSITFLARALSRRPFDLAVNTPAVEVVTDKGKVAGVKVMTLDKGPFMIRSKHVIVSASALQTPRILLNSGIPGRSIGHYLTNHSYLVATASVSTKGFDDPVGALGIIIPQTEGRPYQLQLQGPEQYFNYHFDHKPIKTEWGISFFYASGLVESRYENYVYIEPGNRDEYGLPEIQVKFAYSSKDEAVVQEMYAAMQRAAERMQVDIATLDGTPAICFFTPGTDYHESGTCRMGVDPDTSATNLYGEIHGVSGLFIADNSVLPTIGAANPTLSTVALAIRTADHIVRRLG
ncbi:GMC family oxidoreductase [Paenibacillus sp. ATY16]|nr:GMC family oxidoreductase [Paenibacillus sp. ATY16]MCK9859034.1 GMC family oxidoreductase [Paenibacillus sp. ATY16]